MSIKAPYLPLEKLREIAGVFLRDYHVTRTLPIPIERIIDIGFEMDIVPVPGLQAAFENVASISNDLSTIYVDEFVYKHRQFRYRFSLAHELSHRILHSDIYRQLTFNNLTEWKQVVASIPPDQYSWIERQAYWLAGLMLVPSAHLANAFSEADRSAAEAGISIRDAMEDEVKVVCANIGRNTFHVSADVILRRLKEDRLWTA